MRYRSKNFILPEKGKAFFISDSKRDVVRNKRTFVSSFRSKYYIEENLDEGVVSHYWYVCDMKKHCVDNGPYKNRTLCQKDIESGKQEAVRGSDVLKNGYSHVDIKYPKQGKMNIKIIGIVPYYIPNKSLIIDLETNLTKVQEENAKRILCGKYKIQNG